jgi:hypothetical protein
MEKTAKKPKLDSFLLAIVLLVAGIALFVVSVFSGSLIVCIFGLGLIFWGALFLLIPPPKHVDPSFLVTSALPDYMTIDRMLTYLVPKNEAYNIPPCPRGVCLPEHLEGLKEMVTFIPAEQTSGMAEIEDIARSYFLIERPKGFLVTSPGIGLLDKIEQKRGIDFSQVPLCELDETLPYLLGGLFLSQEIKLTVGESEIVLQIDDSLYSGLYSEKYNLKSISLLGCPMVNAAGCAIAKSLGKPTMIQEIKTKGKTTVATFRVVNWKFEKLQKLTETVEKASLRANELVGVISASIGVVDLCFDILIGLEKRHINWEVLEGYSKVFGETLIFPVQSMPPQSFSFQKIASAIDSQNPKETSKEAYNILKVVFGYFESSSFDDDLEAGAPNFKSAKDIILSYYTLNDLLLGRVVGEKENKKEIHQLESVLQTLADSGDFKVDINALMASIDEVKPGTEVESVAANCRGLFKEQLKQMNPLFSRSLTKRQRW